MTDNEQKIANRKAAKVSSSCDEVPDAVHSRFRKAMCRCSEEGHNAFALNKLHDHFSKTNHKSVDSCVFCGSNKVYEYYFTMDRFTKKTYHNCSPLKSKNTSAPLHSSKEKDSSSAQPISQSPEISDAESSGIGTGCSSMVSIFNGGKEKDRGTEDSPSKSSNSISYCMPEQGNSPSGSLSKTK